MTAEAEVIHKRNGSYGKHTACMLPVRLGMRNTTIDRRVTCEKCKAETERRRAEARARTAKLVGDL